MKFHGKRPHERIYIKFHEDFHYKNNCGKRVYASRSVAKSDAKNLTGSGDSHTKPGKLRPYYCDRCEGWHIGHSTLGRPY